MPHRIILLNFTEKDADTISKAGYNIERGMIGGPSTWQEYIPFQTPHPLYEYDILLYDSHSSNETGKGLSSPCHLPTEHGSYEALTAFAGPPHVRIAFIGESSNLQTLIAGGLRFCKID
jgi:hypothetical protein